MFASRETLGQAKLLLYEALLLWCLLQADLNEYHTAKLPIYHFDLYRLEDGDSDLEAIGFDEYVDGGHCIIEWSEYLENKPENAVYADIRKTGEETRKITIIY